jgi:RimJ/RimL family protein N-acetyltransferase
MQRQCTLLPMMSDIELLSIQFQTLFLITGSGRIERENDPDHSPGPRLYLAGCVSGNVAGLRSDVTDDLAAEIMSLVAKEPPFFTRDGRPQYLDRYTDLLSREDAVRRQSLGVIYELPNDLEYRHDVPLIDSESDEGERLHTHLSINGMPAGLLDMGFRDVSHFWAPWCVALQDGLVASVAFAARLSKAGAEIGVATAPAFRGRGYAAAASARWSRLQSLQSRALFYSTDQTNRSSQLVATRLGLRFMGASLRIS